MKKQYFLNAAIIDPKNSLDEMGGLIVSEEGKIEAVGKLSLIHISEPTRPY